MATAGGAILADDQRNITNEYNQDRQVQNFQGEVVVRSMRRQKVFLDRENPLETWSHDENEIRIRFRFLPATIYYICSLVKEFLQFSTRKSMALPVLYQVLIALKFYATGDFYTTVGDCIKVHRSTACRCVTRVSLALRSLTKDVIRFPNAQQRSQMMIKFGSIAGFPGIFGCVDGCLIPIKRQSRNNDDYVCRKNFPAMNVQVYSFFFSSCFTYSLANEIGIFIKDASSSLL
jgi:hypothetical protein